MATSSKSVKFVEESSVNSVEGEKEAKSEDEITKLEARIRHRFNIFDQNLDETISADDAGTVIRALNLYPTNAQVAAFVNQLPKEDSGRICLEIFLPKAIDAILGEDFQTFSGQDVLQAFRALETESPIQNFICADKFKELLTTQGEPMNEKEITETLRYLSNSDEHIYYENHINKLVEKFETMR